MLVAASFWVPGATKMRSKALRTFLGWRADNYLSSHVQVSDLFGAVLL